MDGAILVLNAGSSSIKFAAFACDAASLGISQRLLHGEIDGVGSASRLLAWDGEGIALYQESGLLGVSGISSDMRTLEASDDPRAVAAIELFVHRVARELGSLVAALEGLDALVFTAGIGEHSSRVRRLVCVASRWLGVEIDAGRNDAGESRIDGAGSGVQVHVIPTDEELMLARHAADRLRTDA